MVRRPLVGLLPAGIKDAVGETSSLKERCQVQNKLRNLRAAPQALRTLDAAGDGKGARKQQAQAAATWYFGTGGCGIATVLRTGNRLCKDVRPFLGQAAPLQGVFAWSGAARRPFS